MLTQKRKGYLDKNSIFFEILKNIYKSGFGFMIFNATFNNISATLYIVAVSFIGGGNRSTRRKPICKSIY